MNPQDFADKWRYNTQKESAFDREHFNDLCTLVGHPTPNAFDPTGKIFGFQADLKKSTGAQGYADVWYKDHFAWEYKGPDGDFSKAFDQLLQYHAALDNPPLLIVANAQKIVIQTKFTNSPTAEYTLTLDDLLTPDGLKILRSAFFNPEALRKFQAADQVTEKAAAHFGEMAYWLKQYGDKPLDIAHFLIRLLFCLFAEDSGLLPERLLSDLIKQTQTSPKELVTPLQQLFQAMSTGGWFGPHKILHFNGHLFDGAQALLLDSKSMSILAEVSGLDWFQIRPSIFGTLFERGLDPAKRSQLGAHYTSEEDILLIVEPVLMAPLRQRWTEIKAQALALAAQRDEAKGKARAALEKKLSGLLVDFSHELASIQVLDAACGSGNFLYIALRLLLDLEKEVIRLAAQLGIGSFIPNVNPGQLHGIEINEYAHQLAQATIWIGYIQWLRQNGLGVPTAPILKPLDTIQRMDAILAFDEHGQPYEPTWPKADVIIGNPPFLGGSKMLAELGTEYVEALRRLYENRVPGGADLVCYWFEKARAMIEKGDAGRAGLLATQGIRGGANRKALERIKASGDIFWAQSDRSWVLNGAAVRVSMIGFDDGSEKKREVDGDSVPTINSDLSWATNLTSIQRLEENSGIGFVGSQKIGNFDIPAEIAEKMLKASGNPNGRPNDDVVKPSVNGADIMGKSRNAWIVDFGVNRTASQAAQYEMPFEYIKEHVYPERMNNHRDAYVKRWWQHGEARPGMRQAINGLRRFIVTSRVSRHRVFVWLSAPALPDNKLCVIARDDDYFFGVLQSYIHEIWSLQTGSRHGVGNDPVYNVGDSFETYPFPWPPGKEPAGDPLVEAIAKAARDLVQQRDNALMGGETLTGLYNKRPTWLANAHRELDQAVFAAYGWPDTLTDEQILERLLDLNQKRAAKP